MATDLPANIDQQVERYFQARMRAPGGAYPSAVWNAGGNSLVLSFTAAGDGTAGGLVLGTVLADGRPQLIAGFFEGTPEDVSNAGLAFRHQHGLD